MVSLVVARTGMIDFHCSNLITNEIEPKCASLRPAASLRFASAACKHLLCYVRASTILVGLSTQHNRAKGNRCGKSPLPHMGTTCSHVVIVLVAVLNNFEKNIIQHDK